MAMQYDDFVRDLAQAAASGDPDRDGGRAAWRSDGRAAVIELVPPMNISLSLQAPGNDVVTTWYPVDAAIVPVVSRKIAAHLRPAP